MVELSTNTVRMLVSDGITVDESLAL